MPNLQSIAATLRAGNYGYTGVLLTIPQTVVLVGAISAVPTYPALSLSYTVSSGAYADVQAGMTVIVKDNTGRRKGLLRVATGASVTSTVLPVNEFGAATVSIASGDTFDVVHEFRIFDKLVSATAALNKDSRIAVSTNNADPFPTSNAGGPVVCLAGASVNFYGSASFGNDPDGGSLTYAWDFDDGTPSSSTSADPTGVTFPAGFRWATLDVTHSNGKVTRKQIPVWALDATYPGTPVQMRERTYALESGWSGTFALPNDDDAHIDALPDGALCVYAEVENYDGTVTNYGANVTGRSNIKLVGFLRRDTINLTPDGNEVTFEVESPLAVLARTPALAQLGISKSSPSKWREIKSLSIRRFLWYLFYWHTTAGTLFDFVFVDGSDQTYSRLAVENIDTALGQLRDIAQSLQVDVTCDMLGRILFIRDPDMLQSSDRSGRTTTYQLDTSTADVLAASITREHTGTTKMVKAKGVTTSGSPVFARSAAAPAPFGTATEELSRLIVPDTDTMYWYAALRFAKVNGLYNGQFVPQNVDITLPDNYDVFDPALREYVTLTLDEDANARGISFSTTTRWTINTLTITYDPEIGAKDISASISHETLAATKGVSDPQPSSSSNGLGNYNAPSVDYSVGSYLAPVATPTIKKGQVKIGLVMSDFTIKLTEDFDTPSTAGGPTYASNSVSGVTGTARQWCIDASALTSGWTPTTGNIYKVTGITGSSPSGSNQQAISVSNVTVNIDFDYISSPGLFGIVAYIKADGSTVVARYTTNGGVTWSSEINVGGSYLGGAENSIPGVLIDPRTPGVAWVGGTDVFPAGTGGNSYLYKTTDSGATYTKQGTTIVDDEGYLAGMVMPFADTTRTRMFSGFVDLIFSGPPYNAFFRHTLNSATEDISPVVSATKYGPDWRRSRFTTSTPNGNRLALMMAGCDTSGTPKRGVFYTPNCEAATVTWQTIVEPTTAVEYTRCALLDPVGAGAILFGLNGSVAYWDGLTVDDRSGNLSTSAEVIGVFAFS